MESEVFPKFEVIFGVFTYKQVNICSASAQQTTHTPFHDMLPHLHTIYDVILLNVLTEV